MANFQISTLAPVFQHDCDACIYIATVTIADGRGTYDLYTCAHGETVIARFADDGPDYRSLPKSLVSQLRGGDVLRLAADLASFKGI